MFLTAKEVADLTGIRKGADGKTRAELQCAHLRRIGVPFWPNAAGEPKVPRSHFEGGKPAPQKQAWKPALLQSAA